MLFDASPLLGEQTSLRWDAFHYAAIAHNGYHYEHLYAFFPGLPFLIGNAPYLTSPPCLVLLALYSAYTLYALSLLVFANRNIARLVALLSLIPTSPPALYFGLLSEPWFTALSYQGMLFCAQRRWLFASCTFLLAACFRSNGVFLAGFIIWDRLVLPILSSKSHRTLNIASLAYTTILAALPFVPFIAHSYGAYQAFCLSPDTPPAPWCSNTVPSIYTYVQAKYWNVGPFRYWTLDQLPNFLLAAPTLLLILCFAGHHLRHLLFAPSPAISKHTSPFTHISLTPHVLHSIAMSLILIVSSHTQITLRVAPAMPVLYWAAAWLAVDHPFWSRMWVGWSVIWGCISIVLWFAFLPPA